VFWRQIGYWLLYWLLLSIPFFVGASVTGLALMITGQAVARVYAANLIGSAAGAIFAPMAMYVVPPEWLAAVMGVIAFVGALGLLPPFRPRRVTGLAVALAATGAILCLAPPHIRPDQYKDIAHLERLRAQGAAEKVAEHFGPRGVISAYRSDAFHDLPFVSIEAEPPSLSAIVIDGHRAGSLLDVSSADEADVVDHTLMAFPYGLAPERPAVLLLGEIGGGNVWLAKRHGASAIDVVQPHDSLYALMRGPLRTYGGQVFDLPGVSTTAAQPRHFVEHTPKRYDLIQLVTLESLATGASGLRGLGQDDLLTVEGISACLDHLSERGILAVSRGIQTPPRDNVKLLATFVEVLRRAGVASPGRHIVVVRDYLGVCTLVRKSPWTAEDIAGVRRLCREHGLTPVWFEGIRPEELNQPDQLPGAPDGVGDLYHYAARQLFSAESDRFLDEWVFDIRPPTDQRPFFYNFCRLSAIVALKRAFGDTWLTRAELGLLFVLFAIVLASVVGGVLILAPLAWSREARRQQRKSVTVAYFASLGLAYLILEITYLSRLTHLIGDPVLAAAVTIGGFLLLSGLGSLTADRIRSIDNRAWRRILAGVVVTGLIAFVALEYASRPVGGWPLLMRCAAALALIAPPAYLMGFPMPLGLRRLSAGAAALVPWAWGVNGFASVVAAPLATAIGMIWGFNVAAIAALCFYALAAVLLTRLPGENVTQA
jgi:hypothetical protein